jgi:hypothetical protein
VRLSYCVSGCREANGRPGCVFADGEWDCCTHPLTPSRESLSPYTIGVDEDGRTTPLAPAWCPLRDQAIVIHLGGES